MALLLHELMGRLKREDEVSLLEILNIDTEMLVERFADLVEDKFETLSEELDDEES